jgi:predicted HTH domain antitoxin
MKDERVLSIEMDLLPEHIQYKDEGCDMSPSCLSCPLQSCVYDAPHGKQAILKRRRNDEILRVYRQEHPSLGEMARIFKVSIRTVQRVLKCGKVKIERWRKEPQRGNIHT